MRWGCYRTMGNAAGPRWAICVLCAATLSRSHAVQPISAPPDPATRWAVFFSVGDRPVKTSGQWLLGGATRALARQYPAQTPGFAYADCAATPLACAQGNDEIAGASDGFGLGWFVSMGSGRGRERSVAPMVRYSNGSVSGDALASGEAGLSAEAMKLAKGVRSSTMFAHVRGGDALAMSAPENAPPFLLRADPTHSAAAHAAVQHVGVPSLMWMHVGKMASFKMVRPLLVNKVGKARVDLIAGQSESEHVGALFASILVANRSYVCQNAAAEDIPAADKDTCENTGWSWNSEEAGFCSGLSGPISGIDAESECVNAGYSWTPAKPAHCVDEHGEPLPLVDGLDKLACEQTGNSWVSAAVAAQRVALKGLSQPGVEHAFSANDLAEAVVRLIVELDDVDHHGDRGEIGEVAAAHAAEAGACPQSAALNVAVSDGRSLVVARARACADRAPPALYISAGTNWDESNAKWHSSDSSKKLGGVIFASEPLNGQAVPVDAAAAIGSDGNGVANGWELLAIDELVMVTDESFIAAQNISHGPRLQRWCLSARCELEVLERPPERRPQLHPLAQPDISAVRNAENIAAGRLRPNGAGQSVVGAGTGVGQPKYTGSLLGDVDDWKPPSGGLDAQVARGAGHAEVPPGTLTGSLEQASTVEKAANSLGQQDRIGQSTYSQTTAAYPTAGSGLASAVGQGDAVDALLKAEEDLLRRRKLGATGRDTPLSVDGTLPRDNPEQILGGSEPAHTVTRTQQAYKKRETPEEKIARLEAELAASKADLAAPPSTPPAVKDTWEDRELARQERQKGDTCHFIAK